MNKKLINEYINDKMEQVQEIKGIVFDNDDKAVFNDIFYLRFFDLANSIDVNLDDILNNFNLVIELDELIDYDMELARQRALEVLSGGESE